MNRTTAFSSNFVGDNCISDDQYYTELTWIKNRAL